MSNVSETMVVRHCFGQDAHAFVFESDRSGSLPSQADQFLALGKFLQDNPGLTVDAINLVNSYDGEPYSYVYASIMGKIDGLPTMTKYKPVCETCGN